MIIKHKLLMLHVLGILYGLVSETLMWNMVMPKVFGLPAVTYWQMFLGSLAVRFIVSQDYTSTILWGKYINPMSKEHKEEAILHRYNLYFGGQTLAFILIWGITTVCL
jgi:hypothetical protein